MQKTLLFLLVLLLHTGSIRAQHPGDYQFQFQFSNTLRAWAPASDGAFFGAGWSVSYPGYPMGVPFVVKWNPLTDDLFWAKIVPMPLSEDVWDVALLPAADGGVYIGAVFDGCDYGTPDGLAKLDASGNILWTHQTPDGFSSGGRLWLLPYPNGHVLYQTDYYRIEYDANGSVVGTGNAAFAWNDLTARQDGGYLLYGNGKIGKTTPLGGILEQDFPEDLVHALPLPSGNWLLLGQEKIYRIAPDFSVLAQKGLTGITYWSKCFEVDGEYWVSGQNNAQDGVMMRIDTAALTVLSTHNSGPNYHIKSLIHLPGDSLVWLSGDANFARNQTVFLKSAPKSDPVVAATRSLALTDIRLEQTPKVYPNNCWSWQINTNFMIRFGDVYVTVKNTGTATVDKFRVNGQFNRCSYICLGYNQISIPYDITLAPGDSVEVLLLENFTLDGQYNTSAFDLCFWTAIPDDRLDAIPEDDSICKTFSVLVSDEEPVVAEDGIRLFPNPAWDVINVNLPSETTVSARWELYDLAGRSVQDGTVSSATFQIDVEKLPGGVYWLVLPRQQVAPQRVVVMR